MIVTNKKIGLIFLVYFALVTVALSVDTYYSQVEQVEWVEPTFTITMTKSHATQFVNETVVFSGNVTKNGDVIPNKTVSLYESVDASAWVSVASNLTDAQGFYMISYVRATNGTCYYKTGFDMP